MKPKLSDITISLLARNRNRLLVRLLAVAAKKFLRGCENYSYNPRYNGKEMILRKLADLGLNFFFDVGANRGDWAKMVKEFFPQASLHCFEIAPKTHAFLVKSLTELTPQTHHKQFWSLRS